MAERSGSAGRIAPIRPGAIIAAMAIVSVAACSGVSPTCFDATLTRESASALEVVAAQVDFVPVLPCGYGYSSGFVVTSVIGDTLPGTPPLRRLSFIVERSAERAYLLSETRAPVTFTQIPQSTHRLRVAADEVIAEGFAGPSGSGGEMAYLRWRIDGVTYELDATLGRALNEAEVQQIALALMLRGSSQSRATTTPSATTSGYGAPLELTRYGRSVWALQRA